MSHVSRECWEHLKDKILAHHYMSKHAAKASAAIMIPNEDIIVSTL